MEEWINESYHSRICDINNILDTVLKNRVGYTQTNTPTLNQTTCLLLPCIRTQVGVGFAGNMQVLERNHLNFRT